MSRTAVVISAHRRNCLIEHEDGQRAIVPVRSRAGKIVCGDRVELAPTPDGHVVTAVLPRRSEFLRAARNGDAQLIAANLDQAIVVVAPKPAPSQDLISRYLVACHAVGVTPVLCINKAELPEAQNEEWAARCARYESLGYSVIRTSAKVEKGVEDLRRTLEHHTSILVGQSGVGKSSLSNVLLPSAELETSELSTSTQKGRHTTSATTLYHLGADCHLMDSPGVWEYGLWRMPQEQIAAGFREFADHAVRCRFANCSHRHEPGCGVEAAVERGQIDDFRLASYRRICEDMERRGLLEKT